jgi:ATP-dependent helicase/nuclease subunit A
MVRRALEAGCQPGADGDGDGALEWQPDGGRIAATAARREATAPALPSWLDAPAPPAPRQRRLTPSTALAGAEATAPNPFVPWRTARAARVRGALVHRLLQSLPDIAPEARAARAARYLAAAAAELDTGERQAILASVMTVLADPAFAEVFTPTSRAEVDIAGRIATAGGTAEVSGRVDRLAVTDGRVLVVDYKTNTAAPAGLADVPAEYIGQLALYRLVLRDAFPGRRVAAALLWTAVPALMEVPEEALDRAEAAIVAGTARADP